MHQPTFEHTCYTVEDVTGPDQEPLPFPDADEDALLTSVAGLGIDVRVWR